VIVAQDDLKRLHDRLYQLEAAIEDVEGDLGANPTDRMYRHAFEHLREAASGLVGVFIEPSRG
jgi:hypothetical protein